MPADVKWGILGCAGIATKVCVAIKEAANATCVAVASRSKEKAETWAAEHYPGARAYGSYDELLEDDEVQVVYIPLPTSMKSQWVLKAAAKKKHVLCDKPLAGNLRDTRTMIDACTAAGVQFMDNTMFMHHERLAAMQKVLDDGDIFGRTKHVASAFSLPLGEDEDWAKNNIRMKRETEPFGCLGDLGWYCIRFTTWAFGFADPTDVSCHFLEETAEGVPLRCVATMRFSEGRTATFDCSFKHPWRQWAEIVGEKCTVDLPDFVIPNSSDEAGFTVTKGSCGEKGLTFPREVIKAERIRCPAQHTRLVEKFSEIVTGGELNDHWPKIALQTQLVLGALVASARRNGAWIAPREQAALRAGGRWRSGTAADKDSTAPVVKKQPKFIDVSTVTPVSTGLNLRVKVVSVEPVPGANPMSTAVIGDASAVVMAVLKGQDQIDLVTVGASLILRNASVRMFKGHIRVQVDRWGKLEVAEEGFSFDPKTDQDMSSAEFELVADS